MRSGAIRPATLLRVFLVEIIWLLCCAQNLSEMHSSILSVALTLPTKAKPSIPTDHSRNFTFSLASLYCLNSAAPRVHRAKVDDINLLSNFITSQLIATKV